MQDSSYRTRCEGDGVAVRTHLRIVVVTGITAVSRRSSACGVCNEVVRVGAGTTTIGHRRRTCGVCNEVVHTLPTLPTRCAVVQRAGRGLDCLARDTPCTYAFQAAILVSFHVIYWNCTVVDTDIQFRLTVEGQCTCEGCVPATGQAFSTQKHVD